MKSALAFLLFPLWLLAQPPALRIDYFTVNDGLSTRDINDLHIGADGFLWVATADGINRFDGHTFRSYDLSRPDVDRIARDNEGRFIVTFGDFYGYFERFDPVAHTSEQVELVPANGIHGDPRAIATDEIGRTFVVTVGKEGTRIYEYTMGGFVEVYHQPDDAWRSFAPRVRLLPLRNGQFLLYDSEHGFRYLSAAGRLLSRPLSRGPVPKRFYTFAQGPDGDVYLSFRDGYPLYRWTPSPGRGPLPVPGLDDGLRYPKVYRDNQGQLLFVATEDILDAELPDEYYLIDTLGQLQLYDLPMPTRRPVTAIAATNFRETIYLGLHEGLGVIERRPSRVETYLENYLGDPLFRNDVYGITGDAAGNTYFLEEDGAIYTFPPGDDYPDSLRIGTNFRSGRQLYYDQPTNSLYACAQPVGQTGGLLLIHDLTTGLTTTYPTDYRPVTLTRAGPDADFLIAGRDPRLGGMLLRFDPRTATLAPAARAPEFEGLTINCLQNTGENQLLVGTEKQGLLRLNVTTDSVHYQAFPTDHPLDSLRERTIHALQQSGPLLWIGTDDGLYAYHRAQARIDYFGRDDGLSDDQILSIVPDTAGGFWLSTANGLTYFTTPFETPTFRRYFRQDGLSADAFNPYAGHRSPSGRYFFGSDNGVTSFREEDLSERDAGADVMFTEIIVYGSDGERLLDRNLDQLRQLTVHADEKSIAFSLALPVGQRPSSSRFRVRLEGLDADWRELIGERTVRYNNLPSGTYTLRAQAAGANGNFGRGERQILIHVRQYLYEHLWFQALVVLLIAGLIIAILQANSRERLRNEQLRTQLSSDIHDEVSGLLAGITLQAELLRNRTDDEKLRERLSRVGEAGRTAMSKMSDVIWSIDSRRDTLGNLLQRMQEHADEVLLPLDIRYDFSAEGFDTESKIPGNIRQDLYFLYKEAINNIARHSTATRVHIKLAQFAQSFEMVIRDNGQGVNPKLIGKTGQGLDNMRMRARRLKAELTTNNVAGYTLVLRMRKLG